MADSNHKGKQAATVNQSPTKDDYDGALEEANDDEEVEVDDMQLDANEPRNTEQLLKKDKTLAELLVMMDDYAPIVCSFTTPWAHMWVH